MERLSRSVLTHPRRAVAALLLLLVAGCASAALLIPNLSERNEYPGLASYEANQRILSTTGSGGYERPLVPVLRLPEGVRLDDPAVRSAIGEAFDSAAVLAQGRAVSYADTADPSLLGEDPRVTFGLVYPGPVEVGGLPGSGLGEGMDVQDAMATQMRERLPTGTEVFVTGLDALATGTDAGGLDVPVKLAVTLAAALAVLLWVFRSSLALAPLAVALLAVPISFLGLLVVSPLITIHETTVIMLPLFGVGIAIDYALIVVARWKEEFARSHDAQEAVHRAMATAGHAVGFSALAVALGLVTMVVLPIPLLRSLGVGGMLVTAASAFVSFVFLPLVLERYGRRLALRSTPARLQDRDEAASRAWTAWAHAMVRWRWPAAVGAVGVLLALCAVGTRINLNVPVTDNLADSGPGYAGLDVLERSGVPSGVLTSFEVYVPAGTEPATVAEDLGALPGVRAVLQPSAGGWQPEDAAILAVLPVEEGGSEPGRELVQRVIDTVPEGTLVGGNVTQGMEYLDVTYTWFPWMLALVALVTFVVLARAFRSVLLPIKAILLNLLSLGAVLGAMVVLWQWGWGTEALLGIQPDGAVGTFVPVTIFAFLYGLSMDYEVFILARVREEYDRTGSTTLGIVQGVGRTGRLVSCAALILFFSFASMASGGELDVSVFATGLALGILLDATLIRSVLVPATVSMMGRWNWWLPAGLARVLRVPPSPLRDEPPLTSVLDLELDERRAVLSKPGR